MKVSIAFLIVALSSCFGTSNGFAIPGMEMLDHNEATYYTRSIKRVMMNYQDAMQSEAADKDFKMKCALMDIIELVTELSQRTGCSVEEILCQMGLSEGTIKDIQEVIQNGGSVNDLSTEQCEHFLICLLKGFIDMLLGLLAPLVKPLSDILESSELFETVAGENGVLRNILDNGIFKDLPGELIGSIVGVPGELIGGLLDTVLAENGVIGALPVELISEITDVASNAIIGGLPKGIVEVLGEGVFSSIIGEDGKVGGLKDGVVGGIVEQESGIGGNILNGNGGDLTKGLMGEFGQNILGGTGGGFDGVFNGGGFSEGKLPGDLGQGINGGKDGIFSAGFLKESTGVGGAFSGGFGSTLSGGLPSGPVSGLGGLAGGFGGGLSGAAGGPGGGISGPGSLFG